MARSGVDLNTLESDGIDPEYFGELVFASGLVMNENVKWIAFHGSYDFGFLLKVRLSLTSNLSSCVFVHPYSSSVRSCMFVCFQQLFQLRH